MSPADPLAVAAGALAAWTAIGTWAERRASHRIEAVPHRILVGGLRGKTTLARLVHAGLRARGVAAVARISGDDPLTLMPDGSEEPWARPGPPHVREIRRFMNRHGAADGRTGSRPAGAVVIENMAVDPTLGAVVTERFTRPTLILMVGGGADHLEVLPLDPHERARAVAGAMTGWARTAGCPVLVPSGPSHTAMAQALSEAGIDVEVCTSMGTEMGAGGFGAGDATATRPFAAALAGVAMRAVELVAGPSPGAASRAADDPAAIAIARLAMELGSLRAWRGSGWTLVDGFSANDPEAAGDLIAAAVERHARFEPASDPAHTPLFNHRADRPTRLAAFAGLLRAPAARPAILIGDAPPALWSGRIPGRRVGSGPRAILAGLDAVAPGLVVGLGNAGGAARGLRAELARRLGTPAAW